MFNRQILRAQFRLILNYRCLSTSLSKRVLSSEFAMDKEWAQRFEDLKQFQLGGSYEWITSVQKKFIGDGKASAVDVDAAACLADEEDQLKDIVEIIYKLRHCENTADMLPSTEYAVFRFMIKCNDSEKILAIINDPINYGIFMNAHIYNLAIDNFIKNDNIQAAAEVATNVMKQEFFEDDLLNLISVYSLLKWLELPNDQRVFGVQKTEETSAEDENEIMEEEEVTFKFPYLRREFNDGHFDLEEPIKLVSKSLEWFSSHLKASWKPELDQLLAKLREHQGEEPFVCEGQLSEKVLETLKSERIQLESKSIAEQKMLFDKWRDDRDNLIQTQAKSINLQLRLKEIKGERKKVHDELELIQFFENRMKWEGMAKQKLELLKEFNIGQEDEEQTEEVYAKTMFDRARNQGRIEKKVKWA